MNQVTSLDGTTIAYEQSGQGPAVVLVGGAFNDRHTLQPLANVLAGQHTVLNVDRRGRGDSGDAKQYAVQREVEDLGALLNAAGGQAAVFGYSSGATLCLRAAAAGLPIARLVAYEPPLFLDGRRARPAGDLPQRLAALVGDGRRGQAVELFQREGIGMPLTLVEQLRDAPFRPGLELLAHTLPYDAAIAGDLSLSATVVRAITTSVLVLAGDQSWPGIQEGAAALAQELSDARFQCLVGESHDINPDVVASAITAFLATRQPA